MSIRLLLTDEAWAEIAPILATIKSRAGSPPVLSKRLCIEAVLSLARTGTPWRHLPADFGHWDAVYNRFRRWEPRGIWRQLWSASGQRTVRSPGSSLLMRRLSAPISMPLAR